MTPEEQRLLSENDSLRRQVEGLRKELHLTESDREIDRRQLTELEKDKVRLDWLEKFRAGLRYSNLCRDWIVTTGGMTFPISRDTALRKAIDQANSQ